MAGNSSPIVPAIPYSATASLAAVSACATRAQIPTASIATNNLVQLTATSTNGLRIDTLTVQACSSSITATTAAQLVQLWMWDGTNANLIQEFQVTASAGSTTSPAFTLFTVLYPLTVPPANKLYVSTTVATTSSTTALQVNIQGGSY